MKKPTDLQMKPWMIILVKKASGLSDRLPLHTKERVRGKSELHRVACWIMSRCCEATESATENKPPKLTCCMDNR
jgi:hypothetical protein